MFVVYRMVSSTRLAACVEKSSSPTDASLTQSQLLNPLQRVGAHNLVVMRNIRSRMVMIMMIMAMMMMMMMMRNIRMVMIVIMIMRLVVMMAMQIRVIIRRRMRSCYLKPLTIPFRPFHCSIASDSEFIVLDQTQTGSTITVRHI